MSYEDATDATCEQSTQPLILKHDAPHREADGLHIYMSKKQLIQRFGIPKSANSLPKGLHPDIYKEHVRKKALDALSPLHDVLCRLKINCLLKRSLNLRVHSVLFGAAQNKQHVSNFAVFKTLCMKFKRSEASGYRNFLSVFHVNLNQNDKRVGKGPQNNVHLLLFPSNQTRVLFLEKCGTVRFSSDDKSLKELFNYRPNAAEIEDLTYDLIEEFHDDTDQELQSFETLVVDYQLYDYHLRTSHYLEMYVAMQLTEEQKQTKIMMNIRKQRQNDPEMRKKVPAPSGVCFFINGQMYHTVWHRPDKAMVLKLESGEEFGAFPVTGRRRNIVARYEKAFVLTDDSKSKTRRYFKGL